MPEGKNLSECVYQTNLYCITIDKQIPSRGGSLLHWELVARGSLRNFFREMEEAGGGVVTIRPGSMRLVGE